ncbi:MAG: ATP-binding cassette domain-containing protein [candidate division Zixibacteria bacterium]|nr:ATP-binding cassette domain-containing protein [candidate division Zixibacteria bacterium]
MNILYSLKNISLKYPSLGDPDKQSNIPNIALDDLSLDIYRNEHLVILGANGSGKSSLGKLLAGLAGDISGEIYYKGDKVTHYHRDVFQDVTMILQEPQNQVLMPTVSEELAYPLGNRRVETDLINSKIDEMAKLLDLDKLLSKSPDELSGGQITAVAMASCLITDPETIILDEPDSHLDGQMNSKMIKLIDGYKGQKTIILITQYPALALNADRVIVLDKGKLMNHGKPGEVFSGLKECEKSAPGFQFDPNDVNLKTNGQNQTLHKPVDNSEPLLSLENISYAYEDEINVIQGINLEIRAGEKLALVGPSGAGKTTLGLIMAGLLESKSGTLKLKNRHLADYQMKDLRSLSTMAMQLPERALLGETVAEDIKYGPLNIGKHDINSIVAKYLNEFGIASLKERHPFSLSGGEKRKVALAGVLAMESEIIILDEPSAALDPDATDQLIDLLKSLNDKTIIVISHDIEFASSVTDRFIGINNGAIAFDLPADKFLLEKH